MLPSSTTTTTAWKCEPYDVSEDAVVLVASIPPHETKTTNEKIISAEAAAAQATHASRRVTLCQGSDNRIHIFNGAFLKK